MTTELLLEHLTKQLRIPTIAAQYRSLAREAEDNTLSYEGYLLALLETNLEFAEWTSIFGDEKMTVVLLDRLTHRAHILLLNRESYWFRQSIKQREDQ